MAIKFKDFQKCVDITFNGEYYDISCKLGLWGVSGTVQEDVYGDALSYWMQYKEDGEYSNILGGESVIDKLVNKKWEGL